MSEPLLYRSTRGDAPDLPFDDALLAGLATDGGLYCPVETPDLGALLTDPATAEMGYAELAVEVMWPFVAGTIGRDDFVRIVTDAYSVFRAPDVVPLVDLGDGHHLLDLAKGPTLAFKDVALQLVGRLMDHVLAERGERVTVLGATSGDTGSAAIEALRDRDAISVVILHPKGRVSDVQRRQMTTVRADNVRNVAIEGTFDDCQDLVKAAFNDPALRAEFGLAAVNSINWARVMAQTVYYVSAARRVRPDGGPVSFSVPTGNFGNILAGWYAKRMGLPTGQLVIASNRNDILTRYIATGRLTASDVVPSLSPSMDIQVSSNFERLLWEASGRDGAAVADLLTRFRGEGDVAVPAAWNDTIRAEFDAGHVTDDETLAEIGRVHDELGLLLDPHTAVGVLAARRCRDDSGLPMITLSTADPAKFPDAVEKATGVRPPLPAFLSELHERPEYLHETANELGSVAGEIRTLLGT
ncbi:MAG: threonine synthase [Acidimicrobiales bacterium]